MLPRTGWMLVGLLSVSACAAAPTLTSEALHERAAAEERVLLERVSVDDDPRLSDYLTGVAQRLSALRGARVTVLRDPTLAAFALPSARIFLHTGLLAALENEAQLAMVLAREPLRDTWRVPSARRVPIAPVALGPTAATIFVRDLRLTAGVALDAGTSRHEQRADAEALRRVVAAGYDARAAARLFEVLAADRADRGALRESLRYGNPDWLAERSASMRALVARLGEKPGRDGADDFARATRAAVRDNAALDLHAGRFAPSRRQLDRVLRLAPDDPIARFHDGDWYRLAAQRLDGPARADAVASARERYQRAIELDPRLPEPFAGLALLAYQERDVAGARAAFQRYLALSPNAADAARVRDYLMALSEEGGIR